MGSTWVFAEGLFGASPGRTQDPLGVYIRRLPREDPTPLGVYILRLLYLYLRHPPLWAPNTLILRITYCASPRTHKFLPRAHAACTYRPAPPRRAIKACADSGSSTVRSAADFVMVTYHSPLTLLRRWPCTPHSHPAQLVAGARDIVAGGTRRGTRVAAAPLSGNGAAYSVPSSILGAFSGPVPPPSTDDRRKDVRARAAAAASGTAR